MFIMKLGRLILLFTYSLSSWSSVLSTTDFQSPYIEFHVHEDNKRWFVTFFEQNWNTVSPISLQRIIDGGMASMKDSFEHENFIDWSYYPKMLDQAEQELKRTRTHAPFFSFWDYVHCKRATFSIIIEHNERFIQVDSLADCKTVHED